MERFAIDGIEGVRRGRRVGWRPVPQRLRAQIRDRVEALSGTVVFAKCGERSVLRARFPVAVLEAAR